MAEKLQEFPFTARGRKYNWDELADGSIWRMTEGQDFMVSAKNFRASLHNVASRIGKRVKTALDSDGNVVFQFIDKDV